MAPSLQFMDEDDNEFLDMPFSGGKFKFPETIMTLDKNEKF
jgi:hypothetical protein